MDFESTASTNSATRAFSPAILPQHARVQLQDFAYDIPPERIAQAPLAERSASRLLTLEGRSGAWTDRMVRDLPQLLQPGDLLVFNDTRVVAARLTGTKPSGGRVEILLERALEACEALVQIKGSKSLLERSEIATAGGPVRLLNVAGVSGACDCRRLALHSSKPMEVCRCRRTSGAVRTRAIANATKASSRVKPALSLRRLRACISIQR